MGRVINNNNSSYEKESDLKLDSESFHELQFDGKFISLKEESSKSYIYEIDFIDSSSSSKENYENKIEEQLERHQTKYTSELISIILEQDFEYGYESVGDKFVKTLMEKDKVITRAWLNNIFLDYFDNPKILIGLLQIVSHLSYNDIYSEGPTMAVASLTHKNAEVRETGVRCFENWASEDSLTILGNLNFEETWLQSYVNEVVSDLRPV